MKDIIKVMTVVVFAAGVLGIHNKHDVPISLTEGSEGLERYDLCSAIRGIRLSGAI